MKSYILKQREINLNDEYDIIVAGGGPAGCAAAIAAARKGSKTLLIEATGCLGGMSTMGLVPAWAPFSDKEKIVYKGIAEEILKESKKGTPHVKESQVDWVPINSEYLKLVYDNLVYESGADILFNTTLCAVEAKNGEVAAIIVSNKSGLSAYQAKVYIDCTGDADLAAWAGAEIITDGTENGYQPATHCFHISNVDTEELKAGPNLHSGDKNSPIHEIVKSGKYNIYDTHMCNSKISKTTIGFNAGHIWNVDNTNPVSVSKALIKGRKSAHEIKRALSDYHPKAFENSEVSLTAPLMGIRETRRILGDYILKTSDYLERKSFEDEICRNCYYIDIHGSESENEQILKNKFSVESRANRYSKGESHGIPYRCLTPKNLTNVLVAGRSISCDRPLQGSTRIMPACICMGEAAGKAAVLAIKSETINIHKVDVKLLQKQIIDDGGYIKSNVK